MKLVVIGGSGLIGSLLVDNLRNRGHQAIAASPVSGVNSITGEGLTEVLKGADGVVDATNSRSFDDKGMMDFFQTSTRNLLSAEATTGVKHHIVLSVVGTDRLQESGYFRAKQVQEDLIRESSIPYTIVHATQFFEFINSIIAAGTRDNIVWLPPADIQPIAAKDVAEKLAELAIGHPVNGVIEIAGPQIFGIPEIASRYLAMIKDQRRVVVDADARYFGARVKTTTLVPGEGATLGAVRFETWINSHLP